MGCASVPLECASAPLECASVPLFVGLALMESALDEPNIVSLGTSF
jgi:hypothetical protein